MKLTAILLLAACLQVTAKGYSQNVTLSLKNASLQKVFKEINKQTGYQFFYKDELMDQAGKIDINVKNVPLAEALNICFSNLPVTYNIIEKTIVVKQKEANQVQAVQPERLIDISGKVIIENGEPARGTTVTVKGSKTATATDANGYFELKQVYEQAILVITATNIETKEVSIDGNPTLNIVVRIRISPLDDVQIIGYGQTTKRLKTGAVSTVKAEVIEKQPVTNPIQALQGRVPGLSIAQGNGSIGGEMTIRIRGVNSIASGKDPLFIVDGVIVTSTTMVSSAYDASANGVTGAASNQTAFNILNPSDIESIDVLKDADATSIYGSRGSNGVIIITTKKAKLGAPSFNMDISTGVNQATYITPRLNTQQYLQMRKDAFAMGNYSTTGSINPITPTINNAPDLMVWDQNAYTNWGKYQYGNQAPFYNIQANLSGGDRKLNYYVSAGYFKQNDIQFGNPTQERISGHLSVRYASANDRLKVNFITDYSIDKINLSPGGLIEFMPPNMPLYNPDGTYYWGNPAYIGNIYLTNPEARQNATQNSSTNQFRGSVDASYRIYKGLGLKTLFSYNYQNNNAFAGTPLSSLPTNAGVLLSRTNNSFTTFKSLNVEPQLNYSGYISRGKIEALLGSTFYEDSRIAYGLGLSGFPSDLLLQSWAAAANVDSRASSFKYYRFNSIFGRATYNWENRYLLNITFRRDGSSRFGPDNKWGNFGSAGIGWIFSNENFIKKLFPSLSYGKFRASYGTTGNDKIADYQYIQLYTSNNVIYNGVPGLATTYLPNASYSWESGQKLDAAIELGFLNDRVLFNVDWFRNRSNNQLVSQNVAAQTGFTTYISNFEGVVENKGWEFEINTDNLNKSSKFSWRTNFNLTLLKNTLVSFPNLASSPYANSLEIGKPIPASGADGLLERGYIFESIDPATGLPVFTDRNKDGIISYPYDYAYLGSTLPTTFGGLSNTFSYKGISLDIFFQFSQQLGSNWLWNGTMPGQLNDPSSDLYGNYWKNPGDVTKYPRLYTGTGASAYVSMLNNYAQSSAVVADLMYVRLKNISLSYSLPAGLLSKAKISKAVIYLRGQNVLTWASEKMYKDPEQTWSRTAPLLKTWSAGIQLSL